MSGTKLRKALLSGAAAIAIMVGASSLAPVAAEGRWQGLYIGAGVGWGGADFDGVHNNNGAFGISEAVATNIDGFLGGVYLGFNHQVNNFVFGIEADVNYAGWDKYNPGANLTPGSGSVTGITNSVDLLASIRGRLGFAPTEDILLFATAGIAFIQAGHRIHGSDFPFTFKDFSLNDTGFVIGGGGEWQFDEVISFRAQGLYYFFDRKRNTAPPFFGSGNLGDYGKIGDAFSLMVGVSFKLDKLFNAGP